VVDRKILSQALVTAFFQIGDQARGTVSTSPTDTAVDPDRFLAVQVERDGQG